MSIYIYTHTHTYIYIYIYNNYLQLRDVQIDVQVN